MNELEKKWNELGLIWNWKVAFWSLLAGVLINNFVEAHVKPTLPPFELLPVVQQYKIRGQLANVKAHLSGFRYASNLLRDDLVKNMLAANPRLKSASPEVQITFSYLWLLQNKRIKVYECHRSLKRQCQLCKEGKSQIGCSKNKKSCDFDKLGEHNYKPSRACDLTYCYDQSCKKLGWGREQLIATGYLLRGVFLLVKKQFYNDPDYAFEDKCLESGIDWDADGNVCSKEFTGKCFADFLHYGIRTDRGYCSDELKLEDAGIFLFAELL